MLLGLLATCACTRTSVVVTPPLPLPTPSPLSQGRTVESVVADIGPGVRARLAFAFEHAAVAYPPSALALLVFKDERRLEIWARNDRDTGEAGTWMPIDARLIFAASGGPGPKLRRGDRQVPEGLYRLVLLNPNSRFHLSMKLDYPNAFDVAQAEVAGRTDLGGDIFVHGGDASIGCVALGDVGIEDLFVLVADVGIEHVEVIVAPHDPRGGNALRALPELPFTVELYRQIAEGLAVFRPGPCL
jgi:hypothetical protein